MSKNIPWHGKKSTSENTCPHCGAVNEYSELYKTVMELSAQSYKICIKCRGEFVDTYLLDIIDDDERDEWVQEARYDDPEENQAELFDSISSSLIYDEDNPDEDSDYYDIPPKSIHFIKGDDDEES